MAGHEAASLELMTAVTKRPERGGLRSPPTQLAVTAPAQTRIRGRLMAVTLSTSATRRAATVTSARRSPGVGREATRSANKRQKATRSDTTRRTRIRAAGSATGTKNGEAGARKIAARRIVIVIVTVTVTVIAVTARGTETGYFDPKSSSTGIELFFKLSALSEKQS